jgi:N-acetylmuramoyl-L-alanine amidase
MQVLRRCLRLVRWLLPVAVGAILVSTASFADPTAELLGVRLGIHSDQTRVVLDLSAQTKHRLFGLTDPHRLVVEFPDLRQSQAPRLPAKRGIVKALGFERAGTGPVRLVLEVRGPVRVARTETLFGASSAPVRVYFDIEEASAAQFAEYVESAAPESVSPEPAPQVEVDTAEAAPTQPESVVAPVAPEAKPEPPAEAAAGPVAFVPPRKPAAPSTVPDPPMIALAALTLVPPFAEPAKPRPGSPINKPIIAIDAGHGGKDPGAVGSTGLTEKDLNLLMAKELESALEATGRYEVVLVRTDDRQIGLRERIERVRAARADLFISLHADHHDDPRLGGASVYTLSEKASDAEAEALAARENKADLIVGIDLSNQSTVVASILIDLAQRETMNRSARFAGLLASELATETRILPNSHRFAGFVVLKAPDVPSVLLELGYLSNAEDEAALSTAEHRARLGAAVLRALDRFADWQSGAKQS